MSDEPEAEPEELPPYVIENARSARSKCKTCSRKIDKDVLRIGVLVDGRFGQGYMWHHLTCGAKRLMEQVEEAYEQEAWLNAKLPPDPDELPTLDKLRALAEKAAVDREKKEKAKKTIPYAEIAPSNRSKCKQSGEPIDKGAVRIILGMEAHFGNQTRVSPYSVLPQYLEQALMEPDMGTEEEGLSDALRENSRDIDPDLLEQAIAEAGL